MRRFALTVLCLLLSSLPVRAQDAPGEPVPLPPVEAAEPEAPAEPEEAAAGLIGILQDTMTGQPVVAVRLGAEGAALPPDALREGDTLLERLQAVCAAASDGKTSLIPFAVRGTWVLAPETQEVVNPNLGRLTERDIRSRDGHIDDLLASLSAEQVQLLGSRRGLGLADLTADQRDHLTRALRPPLLIRQRASKRPPAGDEDEEPQDPLAATITDPPDWSRVRLRGRLLNAGFTLRDMRLREFALVRSEASHPQRWIDLSGDSVEPWSDVDVPAFAPAPNRYKPCDLDGGALTAPFGAQGVLPLSEVLALASRVTGLRLAADMPYREVPVFVGSDRIPVGDVLDGLRLALTAAWRRLDDTYILAWEHRGLGAVQLQVQEATAALRHRIRDENAEDGFQNGNRALALTLPFDPEDPLALTPDQRERLARMPASHGVAPTGIPFLELNPAQQDAVREIAARNPVRYFDGQGGMKDRPFTEEDLQRLRLEGDLFVALDVTLHPHGEAAIVANKAVSLRPPAVEEEDDEAREPPKPEVWTPHAAQRVLMVPVLGPARLGELADEMHRAGLNVLFYPALFGGYATFLNKAFPLHPALRGEDGLAAAGAAMRPKGIRVVAYLNTLAWQDAGDRPHWMDRHRDWWDVDVLGRTRLEWLERLPKDAAEGIRRSGRVHNHARASEPNVEGKLLALLDGLAARRDVAGVAFSKWAPDLLIADDGETEAPLLGFTLPDRIAAFREHGADPVDRPLGEDVAVPKALSRLVGGNHDEPTGGADRNTALLARLLRHAKAKRPDWTTYALDELQTGTLRPEGAKPEETPIPDAIPGLFRSPDGLLIMVSPPEPETPGAAAPDDAFAAALGKLTPLQQTLYMFGRMGTAHSRMVVLDFRAAPEAITDSLRWVRPPGSENVTKR